MSELDDKIHRIAGDAVDGLRRDVDFKIAEVRNIGTSTNLRLSAQDKVLAEISTKVDAMYGNGSGRKGILDEIKEQQKENKDTLIASQLEVKKTFDISEERAAKFRNDMRESFENIKVLTAQQQTEKTVTTQIETKYGSRASNEREWVKWVLGGIAFVSWELIKIYVLKGKS